MKWDISHSNWQEG